MEASQLILDKEQAAKKLRRMAIQIAERNTGTPIIVLAGIKENGSQIAKIIAKLLKEFYSGEIHNIELYINKKKPLEISFSPLKNPEGCTIVLIDDVANSGRTMQYALQPLLQLMPASVQTLALVERTHKQFPLTIDYTGITVSTTTGENIVVNMENGNIVSAALESLKENNT